MKKYLAILAWISIIGSLGDGLIALYCIFLANVDPLVNVGISVDSLIKNHIGFLYWVKEIAYYVLPAGLALWVFSLPALIYFPLRVVSSVLIGFWILHIANTLPSE